MEDSQLLQPTEEACDESANSEVDTGADEAKETEEMMEMPFGILGITLLCNITQYAAFLGITVLIIMILVIFGPK